MTTTTIAQTVAQDETIRAIRAELAELSEMQTRLAARHHALHALLAHRFDNRIPVPPEVTGLSTPDASREIGEIDRQLAALERRVDAQHAVLVHADAEAQAKILELETPAYRRLVAACERAKAEWDKREAARLAFLADLRCRGVFLTPVIKEGKA